MEIVTKSCYVEKSATKGYLIYQEFQIQFKWPTDQTYKPLSYERLITFTELSLRFSFYHTI